MASNVYNPTTGATAYIVPGQPLPEGFQPSAAQNEHLAGTSQTYSAPQATANAIGAINGGYSGNYQVPTTISPSNLSPVNPVTLPTPQSSTTSAGIIASANPNALTPADQAKKNINDLYGGMDNIAAQKQSLSDKVKSLVGQISGIQSSQQNSTEEQQLATERQNLASINDEIAREQVALRGEQDAIKSRGDISSAAQQGMLSNLNDTYGRRLADLAIRQSAAQGNVTALTAASDRALEMKLAPLKTELSYYTDFLSKNLDSLSEDQKTKLNAIIQEKKSIIDQTTNDQTIANTALNTALQNGVKVPDSVVQQILQNPSQAYSILASNGISLANPIDEAYKKAQTAKLYADIGSNGSSVSIKRTDANGNPLPPTAQDTALQTILGSGKFTKDQVKLVTNAINNGQDPFTVIKNQAKNIMGQTEATTLSKYEVAQKTLSDIGDELAQFYANGGKTSLISGNFEKVINNLGQVNDPKLVALATQIQGNLQVYRNAISGTAYSAQEGKDIASIFPGINKSAALNKAILNGRDVLFNSIIDNTYRATLGSAYDELKKADNASKPIDPAVAKQTVNDFIASNPMQYQTVAQLYSVPNTTDADVVEYLKLKGLLK